MLTPRNNAERLRLSRAKKYNEATAEITAQRSQLIKSEATSAGESGKRYENSGLRECTSNDVPIRRRMSNIRLMSRSEEHTSEL